MLLCSSYIIFQREIILENLGFGVTIQFFINDKKMLLYFFT